MQIYNFERRDLILDLLIEKLTPEEGICNCLNKIYSAGLIQDHEYYFIRNELKNLFKIKHENGLRYDYIPFLSKFKRSDNGLYYFKSYKDRIEFLKSLKTA